LRTCDAVGIGGVIVPKDQTCGLTPVVCKVACGAAEWVPIYRVTNLVRTLNRLKEAGFWIVGAASDGEKVLFEADLTGPLALVVGGEGKGLRRLTREACDFLVRIPLHGKVESLNLSVAAGILLYEALRQRQYR
jgi:23S rRNA (guanosine2251-2'-O)-methyltransferase